MWLTCGLYFMVFAPRPGGVLDVTTVVSSILLVAAWGGHAPQQVKRFNFYVAIWWTVLMVYGLAVYALNRPGELYVPLRFLRVGVQILGVSALMRLYYRRYGARVIDAVVLDLFWVIAANACLLTAMYLFEPVREFIWSLDTVEYQRAKRVGGFTGALDATSAIQAYGILLMPFILHRLHGSRWVLAVGSIALLPFSVLMAGRTGVVVGAPLGAVALATKRRALGPAAIIGFVVATLLVVAFLFFPVSENILERWLGEVSRLNQLILPTASGGLGLAEQAATALLDDYRFEWPTSLTQIIWGDGRSGRTDEYRIPADPGWILDVHAVGVVGTLIMLVFYFLCIREAIRAIGYHKDVALCSLLFCVLALLVNCKVLFLLARIGLSISHLLLLATVYARFVPLSVKARRTASWGPQPSEGMGRLKL